MTERVLSPQALHAMLAENTGDIAMMALRIIHDDLADDIRLVANTEDLIFESEVWQGVLFTASLPEDSEESVPTVKVGIDNVDSSIVETIRALSTPPMVEMSVLLIKTNGIITRDYGPAQFRMNLAEWDALTVEGALGYEADYLNEPAQADSYDATTFPGLFV